MPCPLPREASQSEKKQRSKHCIIILLVDILRLPPIGSYNFNPALRRPVRLSDERSTSTHPNACTHPRDYFRSDLIWTDPLL